MHLCIAELRVWVAGAIYLRCDPATRELRVLVEDEHPLLLRRGGQGLKAVQGVTQERIREPLQGDCFTCEEDASQVVRWTRRLSPYQPGVPQTMSGRSRVLKVEISLGFWIKLVQWTAQSVSLKDF